MANTFGLYFPIFLEGGKPIEPTLIDSIDSSLRIILNWVLGTRNFNEKFGTILIHSLQAPVSFSRIEGLKMYLKKAIQEQEKRINLTSLEVYQDKDNPSRVYIEIQAKVKTTNQDYYLRINEN